MEDKVFIYHVGIVDTNAEEESLYEDRGFVFAPDIKVALNKLVENCTSPTEELYAIEVFEGDFSEEDATFSAYQLLSDCNINKPTLKYELEKWCLL